MIVGVNHVGRIAIRRFRWALHAGPPAAGDNNAGNLLR
jgi:hypothetical protein